MVFYSIFLDSLLYLVIMEDNRDITKPPYDYQKLMKSSEEVFVGAGGVRRRLTYGSKPALKFYDVKQKKKVSVSNYKLLKMTTKNGARYRAKSGKLSRFVSEDFYNRYK